MRLITNKSKNLLYRIVDAGNVSVQFTTSYAVATQRTADSATAIKFKIVAYKGTNYYPLMDMLPVSSVGKFTKTFTTPSTTGFTYVLFGVNGSKIDTACRCDMDLKPSTTYTFTCNFTNITQGSISWKDMMLVEGSTAGEYEPYSYNLLDKWQYAATQTINGVTFTNNGDGTITYNGVTSVGANYSLQSGLKVVAGHKYLSYVGENTNDKISVLLYENEDPYNTFDNRFPNAEGGISTALKNSSALYYQPKPRPNISFSGFILKPQLYDLTLMYGAGKEPTTVEQFYTDHPELKVSPLGFIGLKNLEISNKNIKRLKYKTWNNSLNLIDRNDFKASELVSGVTFTNNGDGSWTLNGTSISQIYWDIINSYIQLNTSHKYLLLGCPKNGSNDLFLYVNNGGALFSFDTGNGSIGTPTKNSGIIAVAISNNMSVDNAIFKPQLYDLTEIYGAGKEPTTVEQFYKDHPLAKTSPLGFSDLGIIPSNGGYILDKYNNLTEELLEENIEKDTVNYHIPDKTNILLNKIEGKTNKIVQLLDKSTVNCSSVNDWTGGAGSDTNLRVANGVVSIDGTLGSYSGVRTQDNKPIIKGHKYYISTWAMCSKNASNVLLPYIYGFSSSTSTLTANEWKNAEQIDTANVSDTTSIGVRYGSGESSEETVVWSVKKPQFFDLTAMYGFGNEPTTVEQFKKDYPQFFDEKLDGIWNVRTSGISTTGKNLFDIDKWIFSVYDVGNGTLIERLSNGAICQGNSGDGSASYSNGWFRPMSYQYPNSIYLQAGTYTLSADYTMIENSAVSTAQVICHLYGDNNYPGSAFTSAPVGSTVKVKSTYTVEEGIYYPIFTLNSGKVKIENIQIELNSTVTDYEPYQENKIDLLSIQTLNGINGVNDYIEVIDKGDGLYDLKKTQNIDSVDLGTLDWVADGPNFYSSSIFSVIKPPVNNSTPANCVCDKYVNCSIDKSFIDGDFGVNTSGVMQFRNSAYTTAAVFKTAMNGVIFYYQLKTPVTATIATNLTYNQISAIRTNGGLLLVNDNNNQKYVQPNVTLKENYQYKS
uniref:Uncharacterized protein n=1 Tax=Siphoviridae sp. ctrpg19 TaxID=2826481 RepID=A0A8S5MKU4_9CAUD|nr:MAG TPA: hypothetical protein [Siphoviridae sp. ctrpg19]